MKRFIWKLGIVLLVIILTQSVAAFADETDSKDATESQFAEVEAALAPYLEDLSVTNCKETLVPFYDIKTAEFLKFLETTFANKSSNSSLTNIAIVRYISYKDSLERLFLAKRPQTDDLDIEDFETQFNAYSECAALTSTYSTIAKQMMIDHIRKSNSQKKAAILMEKYNSLNGQLRQLHLLIARTYGLFLTFQNKLPGFTEECVQ